MASREAMVRALWLAHQAGHVDEMLEVLHPSVTWLPMSRPGLSVYQGHDGVRKMVDDMRLFVGEYLVEVDTFAEQDEDRVIARGRIVAADGRDPLPIEWEMTFADGLISHVAARPPTD